MPNIVQLCAFELCASVVRPVPQWFSSGCNDSKTEFLPLWSVWLVSYALIVFMCTEGTFSFYHKDCCSEHGNLEPNQNRSLVELVSPWQTTSCSASVTQAVALSVSWPRTVYLGRRVFHVFSCILLLYDIYNLTALVLNCGILFFFLLYWGVNSWSYTC